MHMLWLNGSLKKRLLIWIIRQVNGTRVGDFKRDDYTYKSRCMEIYMYVNYINL